MVRISRLLRVLNVFVLFLIVSHASQAQFQVSGKVYDNQGEPLLYATVLVLNQQDSLLQRGGISKEDGQFSINLATPGSYLLSVRSIGYQSKLAN